MSSKVSAKLRLRSLLLGHYDAFRGRRANNFSKLKTNNDEIPQPGDGGAPLKVEILAKEADARPIEKEKEGGGNMAAMPAAVNAGHRDMKCMVAEDKAGEEERMDNRIDNEYGGFYPGSPSFRIYCIRCDDDEDDDDGKTEASETESLHDDSSSKASDVSKDPIISIQGLRGKTEKRHKKGGMFKCMMPKGGPISMKNFLKMQSCYYPCSCNDRTHLLPPKTVA